MPKGRRVGSGRQRERRCPVARAALSEERLAVRWATVSKVAHSQSLPVLRLKKPIERVVAHGHPWIFAEALQSGGHAPGEVVRVLDRRGRYLATGLAESGPIGVRIFTRDEDQRVGGALFHERVAAAFDLRDRVVPAGTDGYRLLHGEGDALPGVVLDRYGRFAVLKLDGAAIVAWKKAVIEALRAPLQRIGVENLIFREGRGADKRSSTIWGTVPSEAVEIREHAMILLADLCHGQKTGMFFDHRPGRHRVRALSAGRRVLNLFGYTGGFSVAAGLGGAREVVTVDSAAPAVELASRAWQLNGLPAGEHRGCPVEVAPYLASLGEKKFDFVIADPPSFAPRQSVRPQALKAYRALHRACLRSVSPGGDYLAASCSSHIDREDFENTLREAAHAEQKILQVLDRWGAGSDHPTPLGFSEGNYLKSVLVRVHAR